MTWYELIWLCSIPTLFTFGFIIDYLVYVHFQHKGLCNPYTDDGKGTALILSMFIFIGGVIFLIAGLTASKFTLIKETEITTISTVMTYNGLDVVFEDHTHTVFTSYDAVERWKSGGKFYKQELSLKRDFGPDESKTEIIIK